MYCNMPNINAIAEMGSKAFSNAETADGDSKNSIASDGLVCKQMVITDVHNLLSCWKNENSSAKKYR